MRSPEQFKSFARLAKASTRYAPYGLMGAPLVGWVAGHSESPNTSAVSAAGGTVGLATSLAGHKLIPKDILDEFKRLHPEDWKPILRSMKNINNLALIGIGATSAPVAMYLTRKEKKDGSKPNLPNPA